MMDGIYRDCFEPLRAEQGSALTLTLSLTRAREQVLRKIPLNLPFAKGRDLATLQMLRPDGSGLQHDKEKIRHIRFAQCRLSLPLRKGEIG
jgi:hypothetical protein